MKMQEIIDGLLAAALKKEAVTLSPQQVAKLVSFVSCAQENDFRAFLIWCEEADKEVQD